MLFGWCFILCPQDQVSWLSRSSCAVLDPSGLLHSIPTLPQDSNCLVLESGSLHMFPSVAGRSLTEDSYLRFYPFSLRLKLGLSLVGLSNTLPSLSMNILKAGQILGWRCCKLFSVPLPILEILPGYRRWPLQSLQPQMLGISASFTLIDSLEPPTTSSLWSLQLIPEMHPPQRELFCYLSLLSPNLSLSMLPFQALSSPGTSFHPTQSDFHFWVRFNHSLLGLPCYLASMVLLIIAWLSCTLGLKSTYKWVHTIFVFLGLG